MGSPGEPNADFGNNVLAETKGPFDLLQCFIPAATPQCHAPNLLILDNGDILCAWFGGTRGRKPDIRIYLARRPGVSDCWSKANRVTFDSSRSEQNPVLFQTPSGDLWLMYTSQNLGDQDSAVVKRQISSDRGVTWQAPEVLFAEPGTFIRQPVIVLDSGSWVMPTFKCRSEPGVRWVGNDDVSAVRVSNDQGETWIEKEVPNSFGAVHMAIQKLQNHSYKALYRSRWADNIYMSTSSNGFEWSEPQPTSLPNPNAGICFDVLLSGRLLAVYNHSSRANAEDRREGLHDDIADADDIRANQGSKHGGKEAFWGAPRAPLCLAWSDDQGESWRHTVLEAGDGYCMTNNSEEKVNRELSYPSMRIDDQGKVHIAFTFWRQAIKYIEFDPVVLEYI